MSSKCAIKFEIVCCLKLLNQILGSHQPEEAELVPYKKLAQFECLKVCSDRPNDLAFRPGPGLHRLLCCRKTVDSKGNKVAEKIISALGFEFLFQTRFKFCRQRPLDASNAALAGIFKQILSCLFSDAVKLRNEDFICTTLFISDS